MGWSFRARVLFVLISTTFLIWTYLKVTPNEYPGLGRSDGVQTPPHAVIGDEKTPLERINHDTATMARPIMSVVTSEKWKPDSVTATQEVAAEASTTTTAHLEPAASVSPEPADHPTLDHDSHNHPPSVSSEEHASLNVSSLVSDQLIQSSLVGLEAAPTTEVSPPRELTVEEKEAEKKAREKEKEKEVEERRRRLEKLHEQKRDATLKRLAGDPEMQAKFKVSLDDIGIVMRTGDDVKHRLIAPLSTWASERNASNLVIFSDKASEYEGWKLQDAILPWIERPAIKDTEAAKFWRAKNQAGSAEKAQLAKRFDGWNLDALKFVSSVHLGYLQLREVKEFKWYIFADDDTYWHLPTLASLLSNLDYEDNFYLGGVSYFGIAFAHGGAGAVASAGAMKTRFIDHASTIELYHDIGATAQYGDTNLARAFEAVDIFYDHSFRDNFNGEGPFQRGMHPDLICQHVVTFHHLSIDFIQSFHKFVKDLPEMKYMHVMSALADQSKPLTSFWHREHWSFNLDQKDVGVATEAEDLRDNNWAFTVPEKYQDMLNPGACHEMCRNNPRCVAWTYIGPERTCSMSDWFRIGHARQDSISGIDAMQFAAWVDTCRPWWPKTY